MTDHSDKWFHWRWAAVAIALNLIIWPLLIWGVWTLIRGWC